MSYSRTCGLELDIFVFGWDMAIQIFLSNGCPYKNHEIALLRRSFFGCDEISD